MDGPHDLAVPLDRPVDLDGVQVHYFRVPTLRRLCWAPGMGRRLAREIAGFDIVHLHSVYLWPTMAAARLAERAAVPYLLAPRGMLVRELIERRSRWVKRAWISVFERRTIARSRGLHVTSTTEADDVRDLGLPLSQVYCVPNGVEVPPTPQSVDAGPYAWVPRPYGLILSRLNWKKGIDRLLAAWAVVPEVPLVVAGNDDEGYLTVIRRKIAEYGLQDRVHLVGEVSDAQKWGLYAGASVFVLPSYSENFGNVVAEAMAMACPVVVTPEVGLAEFVAKHAAGRVSAGEPGELARNIREVLEHPQRTAIGQRARAAVLRHLSWSGVAEQMELAYEQARARPAS